LTTKESDIDLYNRTDSFYYKGGIMAKGMMKKNVKSSAKADAKDSGKKMDGLKMNDLKMVYFFDEGNKDMKELLGGKARILLR